MAAMSTKFREVIWGGQIMRAKIHVKHTRPEAQKAPARLTAPKPTRGRSKWRAYGGPAQPSTTIGQCIHGGLGWLEIQCNRCKTRASLPLNAIRRPRDTPILETGSIAEMPVVPEGSLCAARADDQAYRTLHRTNRCMRARNDRSTYRRAVSLWRRPLPIILQIRRLKMAHWRTESDGFSI